MFERPPNVCQTLNLPSLAVSERIYYIDSQILTMNRFLFLPVLFSIMFFSCSKSSDSSNPQYYFNATVNGQKVAFNTNAFAQWEINGDFAALMAGGYENNSQDSRTAGFVIINLPSKKQITAGAYNDSGDEFEVIGSYNIPAQEKDYQSGTTLSAEAERMGMNLPNKFELIITSVSDNIIQGSFSGDFYLEADPMAEKVTITNGSFRLKVL